MCDYSIVAKRQMKATKGQKMISSKFEGMSTGFAAVHDSDCAVCLLPGTEIAFARDVEIAGKNLGKTARFRQTDMDKPSVHHDRLEFAVGEIVAIGNLPVGLEAEVLQLPLAESLAEEVQAKPTIPANTTNEMLVAAGG